MSVDPRAIADKTGVAEEDVLAVLDALGESDGDEDDNRAAGEERSPEEIMSELERFLDERDTSSEPVFDFSGAEDDVYAREHVENLKRITADRE